MVLYVLQSLCKCLHVLRRKTLVRLYELLQLLTKTDERFPRYIGKVLEDSYIVRTLSELFVVDSRDVFLLLFAAKFQLLLLLRNGIPGALDDFRTPLSLTFDDIRPLLLVVLGFRKFFLESEDVFRSHPLTFLYDALSGAPVLLNNLVFILFVYLRKTLVVDSLVCNVNGGLYFQVQLNVSTIVPGLEKFLYLFNRLFEEVVSNVSEECGAYAF